MKVLMPCLRHPALVPCIYDAVPCAFEIEMQHRYPLRLHRRRVSKRTGRQFPGPQRALLSLPEMELRFFDVMFAIAMGGKHFGGLLHEKG